MGGDGSGGWNYHDKRRTVEDTWTLDISALSLRGSLSHPHTGTARAIRIAGNTNVLPVRYSLVEDDEGPALRIRYARQRSLFEAFLERYYGERVGLLITEPARGGVRWWFACPLASEGEPCGRRVAKLHLPPGGRGFGCRRCHDLTYESSQQSHATDSLAAFMAGGVRSGESYEACRIYLANFNKAIRWQRKKNAMSPSLFEAFEEKYGLDKKS
jgi:hypothetical protein